MQPETRIPKSKHPRNARVATSLLLYASVFAALWSCFPSARTLADPHTIATLSEQAIIFINDELLLPPYIISQSDSSVSINGQILGRLPSPRPTQDVTGVDSLFRASGRVATSLYDAGGDLSAVTDSTASFLRRSSLLDSVAIIGLGIISAYSGGFPTGSIELDVESGLHANTPIPAAETLAGFRTLAETLTRNPGFSVITQSSSTLIPASHRFYQTAFQEFTAAPAADESQLEHWTGVYVTPAMARSAHDRLGASYIENPSGTGRRNR